LLRRRCRGRNRTGEIESTGRMWERNKLLATTLAADPLYKKWKITEERNKEETRFTA
jgi:hypothetical protein